MKWTNIEKKKGWEVKGERPEEIYGNPNLYYTLDEIERYCRSGGMRKAQAAIAYRILDLLSLEPESKILDLGGGPGFTTQIYKDEGYQVIGLDVLPEMLKHAKEKGLKTVEGDMRSLSELFTKEKFDAVVSASAMQWLKEESDLAQVAAGIHFVLKKEGKAVIQFYPKSEEELKNVLRIFKRNGFDGEIITDNPDMPKKRVVFLVLEKKSECSQRP